MLQYFFILTGKKIMNNSKFCLSLTLIYLIRLLLCFSNLEDTVRPVKEHSVISDPGRRRDKRVRHRRARRAHSRSHTPNNINGSRFGYEITDVDAFLTKVNPPFVYY